MERFKKESLSQQEIKRLEELSRLCKGDILTMTTLANSGHPGGAISSLDIYLTVFSYANISPSKIDDPERDKIIISHGHTSAAVYSVLGRLGFFDIDMAISTFRLCGSIFEGHIVRKVPGVEWGTGNLGQGLSAGCGFALSDKIHKRESYTFVIMSDGEQTKGQVGEARRFATKYNLSNLTVIIDYNRLQISGDIEKVMPCKICENYKADGWEVMEADGHNFEQLYQKIRESLKIDKPVCIIAHTVMGKGISFMENQPKYHGKPLNEEEYKKAMEELGLSPSLLDKYRKLREKKWNYPERKFYFSPEIEKGKPIIYSSGEKTDNRSAFGKALLDLAKLNAKNTEYPIIVFDCDLASSVKTDLFQKEFPDRFFQVGVQEHNAATIAGASSVNGVVSFFADFGVFGVDETYNQQRLNDQNFTNLKLICTHLGIDVGEDGKTHQCIDYIGVLRNLYGFKIIIPADPNQTDRVIRYIVDKPGNWFVGMGRSKTEVILKENGEIFFDENYKFEYGKADLIREGKDGYIITMGCMVQRAIKIYEELKKEGIIIGILNFSCPTVVDEEMIEKAISTNFIITYEDHNVDTGLGCTVGMYLLEKGYKGKFFRFGIKDYGGSGKPDDLFEKMGINWEN
ncbi:MAG TPA: transketolase, partial [bacterium]|nr:transketolase [bacterium]